MSRPKDFIRRNIDPLGIFAVALTVRLVHVWQLRASPFFSVLMGDSRGYDEWARRIAAGDWIGHEVFYQAPLYPYMLGVIYAFAGHHLLVVRVIQAVIGSVSCALLGLAAARLFMRRDPEGNRGVVAGQAPGDPERSRRVGLTAGLMLALYAPAVFFDGLIQKSVLDVFFVCVSLWLIAGITVQTRRLNLEPAKNAKKHLVLRSSRPLRSLSWDWLGLGLAMGGLSLTRENALVFIIVIVVWALIGADQGPRTKAQGPKRAAVFLTGLGIVLVPVAARNSIVGGGFYVTTSQSGPNLYIGNNPRSDGTYQSLRFGRGAPEYERQDATDLAERALGRRLTPAEVSSYWTDQALDFITSRPGEWLTLVGRKIVLLSNASEMLDTESQEAHADWSLPLRLGTPFGHFGVLVPLALFGVIITWPMRSRLWVVYAMALLYAASVVLFYVFARYRYPLVPFLMIFAAAGVTAAADAIRRRAWPGRPWTMAAVATAAVFSNWPMLSTDLMRAVTANNLGTAFQDQQRFEEAAAHYRRAIAIRSDYAPAYNNLGVALKASGHLGEAVATYEQALRVRPDFPDAHYNLANALLDEGNADAAIEHFQIALRSLPGSVDVDTNLGIALASKGSVEAAINAFRAALEIDPNAAKVHRNLGDVLASAGRTDEAIDHLRRAVELSPSDASIHYDVGSVLLEAHRLDEAIAELRESLKLAPDNVEAHNNLGIALGSQGQLDDAIDEFRRALQLRPGFADAQRNLTMAVEARNKG